MKRIVARYARFVDHLGLAIATCSISADSRMVIEWHWGPPWGTISRYGLLLPRIRERNAKFQSDVVPPRCIFF
jgi:hypothetical protein